MHWTDYTVKNFFDVIQLFKKTMNLVVGSDIYGLEWESATRFMDLIGVCGLHKILQQKICLHSE